MELEDFWSCILLMDCLQVINETHSQCNKASGKCFSSNSQKVRNVFLTEKEKEYESEKKETVSTNLEHERKKQD